MAVGLGTKSASAVDTYKARTLKIIMTEDNGEGVKDFRVGRINGVVVECRPKLQRREAWVRIHLEGMEQSIEW